MHYTSGSTYAWIHYEDQILFFKHMEFWSNVIIICSFVQFSDIYLILEPITQDFPGHLENREKAFGTASSNPVLISPNI